MRIINEDEAMKAKDKPNEGKSVAGLLRLRCLHPIAIHIRRYIRKGLMVELTKKNQRTTRFLLFRFFCVLSFLPPLVPQPACYANYVRHATITLVCLHTFFVGFLQRQPKKWAELKIDDSLGFIQ